MNSDPVTLAFRAREASLLSPEIRVEAGAQFLDEQSPGWHQRIRSSRLNITDMFDCVLGQLYTTYARGRRVCDLDLASSIRLGFTTGIRQDGLITPWQSMAEESHALEACWRSVIRTRREKESHGESHPD